MKQMHGKSQTRNVRVALALLLLTASILLAGSVVITSQTQRAPQTRVNAPPQATATPAVATASEAKRETLAAKSLGGAALPYRVLLPSDYATSSRRYPVLYLLHGLTGDENDWWARSKLAQYAARYHLIIVTPGAGDSWYANSATDPHSRYEDAIILDLIPHVDSSYRTIAAREGRAIAGLSMGGLGAMKFALRYPQLFAFAASFSGAFDVPLTARLGKKPSARMLGELQRVFGDKKSRTRKENDLFALLRQPPPEGTSFPYLYVSTGKSDPLPQVSSSNPRFAEALRANKLEFEYNERPGTHDWNFWDEEIKLMLGRMCVLMRQICN